MSICQDKFIIEIFSCTICIVLFWPVVSVVFPIDGDIYYCTIEFVHFRKFVRIKLVDQVYKCKILLLALQLV